VDQVGVCARVHVHAERDDIHFFYAQHGHDAVVVEVEKRHFPDARRRVCWTRGVHDGGLMTKEAGTLAPRAPAEPPRKRDAPSVGPSTRMPFPPPYGRDSQWPRARTDAATGGSAGVDSAPPKPPARRDGPALQVRQCRFPQAA